MKRVLLKLSGESLAGDTGFGIQDRTVKEIAAAIAEVRRRGVEIALVVGGGNFWRGRSNPGMDRVTADHIGMLATSMNALAVSDALEQDGVPTRVMNAVEMNKICEPYIRKRAIRHLEKGRVVIFAGGTGSPFFTTDSAAALRASEIDADLMLKATLVDGVYDKDPKTNPDAVRFDVLSFDRVLSEKLGVIDAAAAALCRENHIPLRVFSIHDVNNIVAAACEENIGTLVCD